MVEKKMCNKINLRIYMGRKMKGIASHIYLSITDLSSFTGSN